MLDFPKMVQLETTVACNATCIICPNQFLDRPDMPSDLIEKVMAELSHEPGVQELHPFFTNEPLMDQRIWDIFTTAEASAPHLGIHLYTNAGLLAPRMSEALLRQPNLRFIAFSLDGASKGVFEAHRPGLNYEKVMANVRQFFAFRDDMRRRDVWVKCVMTLTEGNQHERRAFSEMWGPLANEVMFHGSDGRAGMGDADLAIESGKVGSYQNDPRWPCRRHRCHDHSMYILSNGDVVPCCKDTTGLTVLGNIREQSLREVWHSERFQEVRRKLDSGIYDEAACRACPFAGD